MWLQHRGGVWGMWGGCWGDRECREREGWSGHAVCQARTVSSILGQWRPVWPASQEGLGQRECFILYLNPPHLRSGFHEDRCSNPHPFPLLLHEASDLTSTSQAPPAPLTHRT